MSGAPDIIIPPRPATSGSMRTNLIASVASQVWAVILNLAVVPIYIRLLGMEALGLIGFCTVIQVVLRILDLGLTPTVIREIARLEANPGDPQATRDFVCTFERLFALIGLTIAIVIPLASPFIAVHWLHGYTLPTSAIIEVVIFMGIQCGLSWLVSLYHGVLLGLERHVTLNLIRIGEFTADAIGSVVLLKLVSPSVVLLFGWQLLMAIVFAAVTFLFARRPIMKAGTAGKFRLAVIRNIMHICVGMAGIVVTGLVLSQMDKILLSKTLSLGELGNYNLAFMGANIVVAALVLPVFNVIFPRFSSLVRQGNEAGLRELYRSIIQMLAALTLPFAAILFFSSESLLMIWTSKPEVAKAVGPLLWILALAYCLNSLMVPAYALQLAHGWTSIGVKLGVFLIVVYVPVLLVFSHFYGALGGARAMLMMYITYIALGLPLTHRRLLRGVLSAILVRDLLPMIAVCAAGGWLLARIEPPSSGKIPEFLRIAGNGVILVVACGATCHQLKQHLRKLATFFAVRARTLRGSSIQAGPR